MTASIIPDLSGSINSGVDSVLGGIKDYQTGQALQNIPRTADGSIDYRAAAAALMRTNPGMAAQFMKLEELKGLQDYRRQSLGIQQQNVDIAKDKSSTNVYEGKAVTTGPDGRIVRVIDVETGQDITGQWGQRGAQPQQSPQQQSPVGAGVGKQPTPGHLQILQADPSKASLFDEVYGAGSAQRYLAGGGPAAPAQGTPAAPPAAPTQSTAAPILQPPPGLSYSQRKMWMENRIKEQSSVDNAELKKADDAIQSGRDALKSLAEVVELNKTAFQGPGSAARGSLASLTGIGGKQAGTDTVVLQSKLVGNMLNQLKSTFGGNPTEGENKLLARAQGDLTQSSAVREELFKDAIEMVRRRVKFNQKYAAAQREGRYMDPTYTDLTPVD